MGYKMGYCKYELSNALIAPIAKVAMAKFAQFCANWATATFAMGAKLC